MWQEAKETEIKDKKEVISLKKAVIFYPNGQIEVKLLLRDKFKIGKYEYICSVPCGHNTFAFFHTTPMSVIPKILFEQKAVDFSWLNLETQISEYLHKLFTGGYQNYALLTLSMLLVFMVILIMLGIL